MAIVPSILLKPPGSGPNLIGRALGDLRRPNSGDLLGGSSINLSQPLPVYRLNLDGLTGNDFLSHAKVVGWRYLIESASVETNAYADVRYIGGGEARFSSLSQNLNAERLMTAAHLAQSVAEKLPDCEARILDVPALYISAVWLTAPTPVFIPYIDAEQFADPASQVEVDDTFVARLVARAGIAREHLSIEPQEPPSFTRGG